MMNKYICNFEVPPKLTSKIVHYIYFSLNILTCTEVKGILYESEARCLIFWLFDLMFLIMLSVLQLLPSTESSLRNEIRVRQESPPLCLVDIKVSVEVNSSCNMQCNRFIWYKFWFIYYIIIISTIDTYIYNTNNTNNTGSFL